MGHGEYYNRWSRIGQERKAYIAGFHIEPRKNFTKGTRYYRLTYEVYDPENQHIKSYRQFGSSLNFISKTIKKKIEHKEKGGSLSRDWQEALNRVEQYQNGTLKGESTTALHSDYKYDDYR